MVAPASSEDVASSSGLLAASKMESRGVGGSDATEMLRLRVSIGGSFVQKEHGGCKYVGGETFLESIPATWRYADLVFSLTEKVNGAVSVKYQLPGEELDQDALITISDDSDIQELYGEYFRALRLPGTPVKTFRMHLFLFRAAEDPYTPEDLAAQARYLDLLPSCASSAAAESLSLQRGTPNLDADGAGSEFSVAGSARGDGATTPSTAAEADLAWEAGFRAGQEVAMMASQEEWAQVLNRRMAGLARVASNYMLGRQEGWQEDRRAWSTAGGDSPPPTLSAPGHISFDSGAADAVKAATAAEVARRASGPLPYDVADAFAAAAPAAPAVHMAPDDADADPEFQSMFESKYEMADTGRRQGAVAPFTDGSAAAPQAANGKGGGQAAKGGVAAAEAAAAAAAAASPNSLLPTHISIFGDGVGAERAAAAVAEFGRPPSMLLAGGGAASLNLPAHISIFGDDDDEAVDDAVDAMVRAALPEEDILDPSAIAAGAPPDAAHLPTDFDLLAAATAGGSAPAAAAAAGPGPGALQAGDRLRRAGSVEDLLSKVQRIDAAAVTVVAKIGEGAFGEVSLCDCPTYGRVAVKWIKPTKVERHWEAFWHEAELMSRLNHPNVLRFYGLVTQGRMVVGIMTEFAGGGSLATTLRSGLLPGGFIPLGQRAQLALHAVNGMAYLHAQKVVHFDVKPDNLLVDGDWGVPGGPVVKVADFGLSVVKYNTFCSNVQDLRGTLPYMAPEMVTDHQHVTEKADVWSLGVVLWELLTLRVPYAETPPAALIGALGSGSARLPLPEWCEPEWRSAMEACWVLDPALRPSCRELARQLERIRDAAQRA